MERKKKSKRTKKGNHWEFMPCLGADLRMECFLGQLGPKSRGAHVCESVMVRSQEVVRLVLRLTRIVHMLPKSCVQRPPQMHWFHRHL